MFYTFNQNNSGGRFTHDASRGIGHYVIVEATSEQDAVRRAQDIGLYFDGEGDCECCGRRWSDYLSDGTEVPTIYDQDVSSGVYNPEWMGWNVNSYIHYMDGTVKTVVEGNVRRS